MFCYFMFEFEMLLHSGMLKSVKKIVVIGIELRFRYSLYASPHISTYVINRGKVEDGVLEDLNL